MNYVLLVMAMVTSSLFGMDYEQQQQDQSWTTNRTWYTADREAYDTKSRVANSQLSACVFCYNLAQDPNGLEDTDPNKYFVIQRFKYGTVVVTNSYPYCPGHLMLVPENHLEEFTDLKGNALYEWSMVKNWTGRILQKEYQCEGHNTGTNRGKIAGQSVKHIHEHIIVRATEGWTGPVANLRVIGEPLNKTHARILPWIKKLSQMLDDGLEDELSIEKFTPESSTKK